MSDSKRVVACVGNVHRVCRASCNEGFKCVLEALHDDVWLKSNSWNDPGALAAYMVKNGVAADHASALALINRPS